MYNFTNTETIQGPCCDVTLFMKANHMRNGEMEDNICMSKDDINTKNPVMSNMVSRVSRAKTTLSNVKASRLNSSSISNFLL